jgi:nitroreductase
VTVVTADASDLYQERYLAHQKRKAAVLAELLAERHSERMFADGPVPDEVLAGLVDVAARAPSSCDRKAISVRVVVDRDSKALLGGLLVGGTGWVHRAPAVLLLFADPQAYKAGDEITFMPYLDAGVIVGQMDLAAGAGGLARCYINPNIREGNQLHFAQTFGSGVYCGALAVGWPRVVEPPWLGDTS